MSKCRYCNDTGIEGDVGDEYVLICEHCDYYEKHAKEFINSLNYSRPESNE